MYLSKNTFIVLLFVFVYSNMYCQWTQVNGLFGGEVTSLLSSGGYVYAGTANNGIFISSNNGSNWSRPSSNILTYRISNFAVITGKNAAVYAGTSNGVYSTTDNGTSWLHLGIAGKTVQCLMVCPYGAEKAIFAGTYTGLYRSIDYGTTWTQINNGLLTNTNILSVAYLNTKIFLGTNSGFYVSHDNGDSWFLVNYFKTNNSSYYLYVDGNTLFVNSTNTLFSSIDNGANFTLLNNIDLSTSDPLIKVGNYWFSSNSYTGIKKSINNGVSWTQVSSLGTSALAADGSNILAASPKRGVFISTNNGSTWNQSNTGLLNTNIKFIYFFNEQSNNKNYLFAITDGDGVFLSIDDGLTWTAKNSGINDFVITAMVKIENTLVISTGIGVYKSTDLGSSWIKISDWSARTLAVLGSTILAARDIGIWKSNDLGNSWVASGLPRQSYDSQIYTIYSSGLNLYAGDGGGNVFLSSDFGGTWSPKTIIGTSPTSYAGPHAIYSYLIYNNYFFAGTWSGIYLSTDNGFTWAKSGSNSPTINNLTLNPNSNTIFAGTSMGLYSSNNYGTSWVYQSSASSTYNYVINSLLIIGDNIYVGSDKGLWKRKLSELTPVRKPYEALPQSYVLEQNFPNPFNPSTVICYQLPVNGFVTLKVYDCLGREVTTLVYEYQTAGFHYSQFTIRNSKLSSGVYTYKLQSGSFVQTKKMVLMK